MTAHPLDPLTADEFRAAAAVLRRDRGVDERWRFASIELREPAKDVVRAFTPGDPIRREARVTCWSRDEGTTYKALVSLTDDAVLSWEAVPGEQANMTLDEWHEAHEALIEHPDVIAALAKRGITDLDLVLIDTWAYGHSLIPAEFQDRRVGWTDVWRRSTPNGNPYANPVNGLHFVVDMNTMELLRIEDDAPPAGGSPMGEYRPDLVPGLVQRTDVKALEIIQPEGPSFTLDGNELRWQNWSMRLGFNHREGLVIHRVGYQDGDELRPIAHRLSFAEMVVPYRDPRPDHHRRTAFDIGEWGLGFMTTSLELGCDCLGEITYVDAVLHDSRGEPYTIKNAICLHEEDDGVLWKHVDEKAGAEVRRSRRMVVSFHATVANYEYLDLLALLPGRHDRVRGPGHRDHGDQRVRRRRPAHRHRRGRPDLRAVPPALHRRPHGHGDRRAGEHRRGLRERGGADLRHQPLRPGAGAAQPRRWRPSPRAGRTTTGPASAAGRWSTGAGSTAWGRRPATSWSPRRPSRRWWTASSPIMARAEVIDHTLWVTPYEEEERWPAGEFCNQSRGSAGLPAWTEADRPIVDTDIVLWHVFGIHHIPRPEDWPVMPVDTVSFSLKPWGFFDRNPALDVPPNPGRCH